jgi:tRNA(Met) C34 N-acetyltransferase TmcA
MNFQTATTNETNKTHCEQQHSNRCKPQIPTTAVTRATITKYCETENQQATVAIVHRLSNENSVVYDAQASFATLPIAPF